MLILTMNLSSRRKKIVNNVSGWTGNQRNKYKKGLQPAVFMEFLKEIKFKFRSKYNLKKLKKKPVNLLRKKNREGNPQN